MPKSKKPRTPAAGKKKAAGKSATPALAPGKSRIPEGLAGHQDMRRQVKPLPLPSKSRGR